MKTGKPLVIGRLEITGRPRRPLAHRQNRFRYLLAAVHASADSTESATACPVTSAGLAERRRFTSARERQRHLTHFRNWIASTRMRQGCRLMSNRRVISPHFIRGGLDAKP